MQAAQEQVEKQQEEASAQELFEKLKYETQTVEEPVEDRLANVQRPSKGASMSTIGALTSPCRTSPRPIVLTKPALREYFGSTWPSILPFKHKAKGNQMTSIGDQLTHLVHQGVQRLKNLPTQVLQHLPSDQVQLGPRGHDHDVLRLRSAYLQQTVRPDAMEMRPATAREIQVQKDREFFHNHRSALSDNQHWAMRGQDGQLHLREHSSQAADIMQAIDHTTRVEAAPLHYLAGEIKGGAEAIQDTARMAKTVAQPFTTLQTLVNSDAGKALDHFRQNSAQITVGAVHQAGSDFLQAQNDPDKGGRATGKLGANIVLSAMPLPMPKRLIGVRGLAAEAPKGVPELGPFPNKIWRTHFEHTRPTGSLGGLPAGEMEKIPQNCAETARSLMRQKESAELLAARGYKVKHLRDSTRTPGSRPDFEVEGKIFDNYAPKSAKLEHISEQIAKKMPKQAQRIVLNLDDCPLSVQAIEEYLQTNRISNLKEVITIRQGNIQHIYP